MGGVAVPCPAGTYGPKEGLQRLRDCTICPAGRVLIDIGKPSKLLFSQPKTAIYAIISVSFCIPLNLPTQLNCLILLS